MQPSSFTQALAAIFKPITPDQGILLVARRVLEGVQSLRDDADHEQVEGDIGLRSGASSSQVDWEVVRHYQALYARDGVVGRYKSTDSRGALVTVMSRGSHCANDPQVPCPRSVAAIHIADLRPLY